MISLAEAQEYVLGGCRPGATVVTPTSGALGLVTAEPIVSGEAVPPFANTAVDGYAVRAADTAAAPVELTVVGAIAAGEAPSVPVSEGTAIRIMTGAPMPPGADAVVMVEDTATSDDGLRVTVRTTVAGGTAVRSAGEDMQAGQQVFDRGTLLQAGHLGVLATLGIEQILTHRRPRVGVISTGNELVEGPQPLAPGQIRDSNRITLLAMVAQAGCEPVDLGLVRDDESAIDAALRSGAEQCDALITSGGVSMGDFDFVKLVLSRIADMRWMQVAIKPAKPLAFGTLGGTPIFGLPGNPVSSMVSFELFARPALRLMLGMSRSALHRPRLAVTAESDLRRQPDGKVHFARVNLRWVDGQALIRSSGGQGSHQLAAMAGADALAVLPDGPGLDAGQSGEAFLLHES